MRRRLIVLLGLLLVAVPAAAETVVIEADRDATLIEDADGAWANGSGPVFFAGRTNENQGGVRRAVLRFDVAGALPPRAIVEEARLTLFATPSNSSLAGYRVHRMLAAWSEGASSSSGGIGAPSLPGDVTWLHTSYAAEFWIHNGGHFDGRFSSAADVGNSGFYVWPSTRHMVRDVREWLDAPQRNHGWILIGDETTRQTVKSFASREALDPDLRPVLEVDYRLPDERRDR